MEPSQTTILIIEDDLDIAEMLQQYLQAQGYSVLIANWGEDGIRSCQNKPPDLVVLDIRLPDIDGFEVARRLRMHNRTRDIPIIFLTEKRERMDRLKGLELHAEDYITKPFDIQLLRLSIRNVLERSHRVSLINSVTELPEGEWVDAQLSTALQSPDTSLIHIRFLNIELFREAYGFVAADDLLRAVTRIIQDASQEHGGLSDFIGHLSPQDFIILTDSSNVDSMVNALSSRLENSFDLFYRDQDRLSPDYPIHRLAARLNVLLPSKMGLGDLKSLKDAIIKPTTRQD